MQAVGYPSHNTYTRYPQQTAGYDRAAYVRQLLQNPQYRAALQQHLTGDTATFQYQQQPHPQQDRSRGGIMQMALSFLKYAALASAVAVGLKKFGILGKNNLFSSIRDVLAKPAEFVLGLPGKVFGLFGGKAA